MYGFSVTKRYRKETENEDQIANKSSHRQKNQSDSQKCFLRT